MTDKIAVILSGCGVYDGSEVHEASAACTAISRAGKKIAFYAPDKDQFHMVNHVTSEDDTDSKRNVLVESARIARGTVLPLKDFNIEDVDGIWNWSDNLVERVTRPAAQVVAKVLRDL